MPNLRFTEQQVRAASDLLYAIATEREGFTFSADGRQQMQSTAHNLDWLLRQPDFRGALAPADPSTLDIVETFVRDMENASLDEFVSDEHKATISRAFRLLRSVADECSLDAEADNPTT